MKLNLASKLHHWELVLLAVLKPLGFWGVGVLAAIDSSSLAIPMDLIIAGYAWSDRPHFWVYAVLGALGSCIGALVPFYIGRAGGEWVLEKRMDARKYEQMRARFDRHHWFAVLIPAAMPPPFPFKLFAFGAGVFDMQVLPYMGAVFLGRAIHYLITAVLAAIFGPQILHLLINAIRQHAILSLLVAALITLGFLGFIFYRRKQRHRASTQGEPS